LLYCFPKLGARWGWVINAVPWLLYPQEREPITIVHEAEWAVGLVWMDAENI